MVEVKEQWSSKCKTLIPDSAGWSGVSDIATIRIHAFSYWLPIHRAAHDLAYASDLIVEVYD